MAHQPSDKSLGPCLTFLVSLRTFSTLFGLVQGHKMAETLPYADCGLTDHIRIAEIDFEQDAYVLSPFSSGWWKPIRGQLCAWHKTRKDWNVSGHLPRRHRIPLNGRANAAFIFAFFCDRGI
ncbi:hypothetical protein C8R44DRAFT_739457 [Mycena epipterygia]|nr:hypothetical protein C8R44DRAFT_739457 [Mycena epipterygia]